MTTTETSPLPAFVSDSCGCLSATHRSDPQSVITTNARLRVVAAAPLRLRNTFVNNIFGTTGAVISVACLGAAVNAGTVGIAHGSRLAVGLTLFAVGAVCSGWISIGQFRAVCIVYGDEVIVRNIFRTTNVASHDVVGVAVRPVRFGFGPYFGVWLEYSEGGALSVRSLQYLPRDKAEQFASVIVDGLGHHPQLVRHS